MTPEEKKYQDSVEIAAEERFSLGIVPAGHIREQLAAKEIFKAGIAWARANPAPEVMALVEAARRAADQAWLADKTLGKINYQRHAKEIDIALKAFGRRAKGEGMSDREYCPHEITKGTCITCYNQLEKLNRRISSEAKSNANNLINALDREKLLIEALAFYAEKYSWTISGTPLELIPITVATTIKAEDCEKIEYTIENQGEFVAIFGGKRAREVLTKNKEMRGGE